MRKGACPGPAKRPGGTEGPGRDAAGQLVLRAAREASKEAADLLTAKPAEPPTAHPPRMPREGVLLAASESRRPAGQPGRRRGPSPGTAVSCAAFTTVGCGLPPKVVTPQQLQAYITAQQAAQSSSGSTQ